MSNQKKNIPDPLKFGASDVCMKCEQAYRFYPADGVNREARVMLCEKCRNKIKKLAIKMGKPQYWTAKKNERKVGI